MALVGSEVLLALFYGWRREGTGWLSSLPRPRGVGGSRPTCRTGASPPGQRGRRAVAGGGAGWALTVDDERGPLGGLLPRLDAVLVDGVLDLLQLLQRVQIRGFPLLLQLLADVGVAGEAAGGLRDLRLNGELAFQALQLGFLWERRPRLALGGAPLLPGPAPRPASLLYSWGSRVLGAQQPQGPTPAPPAPAVAPLLPSLAAGCPGSTHFLHPRSPFHLEASLPGSAALPRWRPVKDPGLRAPRSRLGAPRWTDCPSSTLRPKGRTSERES